eukprot:CAMPEP_0202884412 /NCGR_PEP_ID=MMETSP1391-20130828/40935_1 /ASSEMBLY_ACC=CAM_ASM_000867 /TAXON_ID=1034604 /ORGANISM="Chlamydomonas leiostraca, Strain SAG 11-49" /LENGTH=223 /DNA_ID=CAMNT_0049567601 /DNA_START=99 /DNA_END=770 /DNA_ORIENTATION=-
MTEAQVHARQASSATTSSSKSDSAPAQASSQQISLTPAQLQAAQAAVQSASQAAGKAARVATLAALSGHYRDTLVSMEAVYAAQVSRTNPLLPRARVPAKPKPPQSAALCSPVFPVMDVTQLPDNHVSVPQGEQQQLDSRYMDKISAWLQTQPNHVETSVPLLAGVALFPPQEATYPTYVDFQSAMRLLDRHKSHKRMHKLRLLRRRQDKYQIRAWDHRIGEL